MSLVDGRHWELGDRSRKGNTRDFLVLAGAEEKEEGTERVRGKSARKGHTLAWYCPASLVFLLRIAHPANFATLPP